MCWPPQVNYAAGEPVWSEREGGDLFYIIKEGSALLKDAASGAVLSKLGPGAHFGQQSLLGPGEAFAEDLMRLQHLMVTR
jgi:CRP-like cAMP-binding protein